MVLNGLIPAWAGKTRFPEHLRLPKTAHPRVGGENDQRKSSSSSSSGSSPRGRGKRHGGDPGVASGRLIPAWAGKTR